MLYTEESVRAGIRNRGGKRVFPLGEGDRLTPSARDWLRGEGIEIVSREAPVFTTLFGGEFKEKPEELTHLYGNVLVPKTHPRIAFRGMIDLVEAEILLCQINCPQKLGPVLQEMLDFVRSLIRCDVLNEPVPEVRLFGLTADQLRDQSHFPEKFFGQPHFMPGSQDPPEILHLNLLRTRIRQAELACCAAFADRDGKVTRPDLVQALNRLSSLCWILMIRCKAEKP